MIVYEHMLTRNVAANFICQVPAVLQPDALRIDCPLVCIGQHIKALWVQQRSQHGCRQRSKECEQPQAGSQLDRHPRKWSDWARTCMQDGMQVHPFKATRVDMGAPHS